MAQAAQARPPRRDLNDNSRMDSPADLRAALATISDHDLFGLGAAIGGAPNVMPGLLAWLEAAVTWDVNRRDGMFYPLLGPRAAIDDTEIDASLTTLAILAACFRGDGRGESKAVAEFLELTASTPRADVERTATPCSSVPTRVRDRHAVRHGPRCPIRVAMRCSKMTRMARTDPRDGQPPRLSVSTETYSGPTCGVILWRHPARGGRSYARVFTSFACWSGLVVVATSSTLAEPPSAGTLACACDRQGLAASSCDRHAPRTSDDIRVGAVAVQAATRAVDRTATGGRAVRGTVPPQTVSRRRLLRASSPLSPAFRRARTRASSATARCRASQP